MSKELYMAEGKGFGLRPDFNDVVAEVPQLKRGIVWCISCGYSMPVSSAQCLATGWPRHCGQTMTIDSPEERAALKSRTGGSHG